MRKVITGTILTRTALHVGSGERNGATDALLRRNSAGECFIPGSAIAGPLRTIATRLAPRLSDGLCQALTGLSKKACGCMVCALFGDINPQEGKDGGKASRLWVMDAKLSGTPTIRDGVGIDRVSGAAARQGAVKFDLEVLPARSSFELRLELSSSESETNEYLLAVLLAEWESRGTLGGRVARGLGAFSLTSLRWEQFALDTCASLMAFLRRKGDALPLYDREVATQQQLVRAAREKWGANIKSLPALSDSDSDSDHDHDHDHDDNKELANYAIARAWVELRMTLQFEGLMLINDLIQAQKAGFDHAPLSDHRSPLEREVQERWLLPGSSLRGVLRSQAERIARTLATQASQDKEEFLRRNPAGSPNNSRDVTQPLPNTDCLLRAAGVPDEVAVPPSCFDLADRLFGSTRLGSRLIVEDGHLVNEPQLKALDFVAIDRFTGGGRDSAKFDALALWQPAFECRLRLDNPAAWELGWLLLALRDLDEGVTTIGWGAAKGFGQVDIEQWEAKLGFLHESDFPDAGNLSGKAITSANLSRTDGLWRVASVGKGDSELQGQEGWRALAKAWVAAFKEQVDSFSRIPLTGKRTEDTNLAGVLGASLSEGTDSYFGAVETLYRKEEVKRWLRS